MIKLKKIAATAMVTCLAMSAVFGIADAKVKIAEADGRGGSASCQLKGKYVKARIWVEKKAKGYGFLYIKDPLLWRQRMFVSGNGGDRVDRTYENPKTNPGAGKNAEWKIQTNNAFGRLRVSNNWNEV